MMIKLSLAASPRSSSKLMVLGVVVFLHAPLLVLLPVCILRVRIGSHMIVIAGVLYHSGPGKISARPITVIVPVRTHGFLHLTTTIRFLTPVKNKQIILLPIINLFTFVVR